jgi:serine/threonine protein kinase
MLLHRDIKPENIFLARSGTAEVAKILDFGLAKTLAQEEVMESMPDTMPGVLIGTIPYMSPERIRGGVPEESWDLWALAVVSFEMLSGVHPFGKSAHWRNVLIGGSLPPLDESPAALPRQLTEFFKRALAADPSQRPSSARGFFAELQAVL